ncbi:hypothetical protein F5B22DRAFT_632030 [Xylaria bambusicola]|uniref:uncharacterized protein n=1 Tax=Xylaria bambusicola TaxID=326684 RepID=UPI002008A8D2|nr:uncharacterized protein F5B22DRAFT_632030 [Xylaria bambusicola]KAI0502791.1 hypothetical protein F5B22DRAFT_632030 [Xylaria bambusicola]
MDPFVNGCHGSAPAIRRAAEEKLHHLMSAPWTNGDNSTGDIARVRHQVEVLKTQNAFHAANLLDVAHPCGVCNAPTPPESKACPVSLGNTLMRNLREKQEKIQGIMTQVDNNNILINKLEDHLKTFDNIYKYLRVEVPGDWIKYFFKIHTDSGLSLVIQDREGGNDSELNDEVNLKFLVDKKKLMFNLVDAVTLPPIPTRVLSPVSALPDPNAVATPAQVAPVSQRAPEQVEQTQLISFSKPKPPVLGIWDTEEERARALRDQMGPFARATNSDNVPQMFTHGIQYTPLPSRYPTNIQDLSRMVVFTGLRPETKWFDVLSRVRGGPILRVVRANSKAMVVYFVHCRDAYAYATHIASVHNSTLNIDNTPVNIRLVNTPSYPVPDSLMREITQRGASRCLVFPHYEGVFGRLLDHFFERRNIRDFTITKTDTNPPDNTSADASTPALTTATTITPTSAATASQRSEIIEEWVDDEERARQVANEQQKSNKTTIFHFRDVEFARNVFRESIREFPYCGVKYAIDHCGGPLDELESTE